MPDQERILSAAIVQADIRGSFDEYLKIFEAFYADDIEVGLTFCFFRIF